MMHQMKNCKDSSSENHKVRMYLDNKKFLFYSASSDKIVFCCIKITEISKYISVEWKKLSAEEKGKWEEISHEDKKRFLAEKQIYQGPWQIKNEENRDQPDATSSIHNIESQSSPDEPERSLEHVPEANQFSDQEKEAAKNLMNMLLNKTRKSNPGCEVSSSDTSKRSCDTPDDTIYDTNISLTDESSVGPTPTLENAIVRKR